MNQVKFRNYPVINFQYCLFFCFLFLMQEEEIAECLWMPVEKYLVNDSIHGFNKAIVQAALNNEGLISSSMEGYEPRERYEFFMPDNNLR